MNHRVLLVFLALSFPNSGFAQEKLDAIQVRRLAELGKVWNAARFLHPRLADKSIDWDSALVAAIPHVHSARSVGEYRSALRVLLDALGDPATRVVEEHTPSQTAVATSPPHPTHRWTTDSILVVTMTNYDDLGDFIGASQRLSEVSSRLDSARGMVFDLRLLSGTSNGTVGFLFSTSNVATRMVGGDVLVPPIRSRMHSGYRSETGVGAPFYYSGWQTTDAVEIKPADSRATWLPLAFVFNERSELPDVALATWAASRATLIATTPGPLPVQGATTRLELGEDITVSLRVRELVLPDGKARAAPDTVVTNESALDAAIARVRSGVISGNTTSRIRASLAPATARAYTDMSYPTLPYRLLAAYRIWDVFEYFNPYRHLIEEDWANVLEALIPRFVAAKDSLEYVLSIGAMLARTHDSHVGFGGSAIRSYRGAPLPFHIRWIEQQPVIAGFLDSSATAAGFRIGDVITSVDGIPADSLIAMHVPYTAASTSQALMWSVLRRFGGGRDGSEALVAVRRGDGAHEFLVRRNETWGGQLGRSGRSGDILRVLAGNIGYADLERLTVPMVDSMFSLFADTDGIVFDMRGYPLGTAWAIAPHLTDQRNVPGIRFRLPIVTTPRGFSATGDAAEQVYESVDFLPPPVAPFYPRPTVMLIDELAISQSEMTGQYLKAANGTVFVGTPTMGANGDVTEFVVPGGITIRFTGLEVRHADGSQLQRVGLQPDIWVAPTIAGVRAGRDEVLEAALEYLTTNPSR